MIRRWLRFSSVGVLGFAVQLTVLLGLAGGLQMNYLLATAIAVELAILHNFLWHQRWTWSDRSTHPPRLFMQRLVRFNAGTALTSIGGNLMLMWLLVGGLGVHYAVANVMTVLSLSLVNFLFCDTLVFKQGRKVRVKPAAEKPPVRSWARST